MVSGNTETGVVVTYDDANAKLNFDAQTPGDARYLDNEHIRGLEVTWNSATSITVGTGQAWNKNTSSLMEVSSAITKSSLSLSASTWYYLYLYDNSGSMDIDISATAPTMDGQYYSYKTGTAARRCVGAILIDGSSNVRKFLATANDHFVKYTWSANQTVSPFRVLSAGTATTPTSVSLTGVVPDVIYAEYHFVAVLGLAANGDVAAYVHHDNGFTPANDTQYYLRLAGPAAYYPYLPAGTVRLTARSVHYAIANTAGSNSLYMDSAGFTIKR